MRGTLLALSALVLAACGGGDPATSDAGARDAGPSPLSAPAPPAAPALPVLTPCPTGWREVLVAGEPTVCDPWPATGHASCAANEMHVPGTPGCARVGSACAADGWPTGLPAGASVRYVRAAAASGGDGTQALPFARIGDALTGAGAGAVIAIGEGTYDEVLTIRAGITLWGACAERTVLTSGVASANRGVVGISGTDVVIRDLRIGPGAARIALHAVGATAGARLDGVVVDDSIGGGILVATGASLTLERSLVRAIRVDASGRFGYGVFVTGATVTAAHSVVAGAAGIGITAEGADTFVTLDDCAVTEVASLPGTGNGGRGISAQNGVEVRLTRVSVDHVREVGVYSSAGTLAAEDLVVRESLASTAGEFGRGIVMQGDGSATLSRVLVEHVHDNAVFSTTTTLIVADLVVRDVERDRLMYDGRGLTVNGATASLTAERVFVARVGDFAVGAQEGAGFELRDLTLREPHHFEGDIGSRALELTGGAHGTVSRVRAESLGDAAIVIGQAQVTLEDALLIDIGGDLRGRFGVGLVVLADSTVVARRVRVERAATSAVSIEGPSANVELEDLVAIDLAGESDRGLYGRGITIQAGAVLELSRATLERTRETGIYAGTGASFRGTDVAIRDVRARTCAVTSCSDAPGGIGLGVYGGGSIVLSRFEITRSALAGIQLAAGGIDLHEGIVSDCPIGANVQDAAFDLARLSDRVLFVDNGRQYDATVLPVPEAFESLGP